MRTYTPLKDNGYDPAWLDNQVKVYRLDPETNEQYLARIEDSEGNVLEDYTKEGDTLAKGIHAVRPEITELILVWEECGHSINKVRAHYKTYWQTAKEWLEEAGLVSKGPVKKPKEEPEPDHDHTLLIQAILPGNAELLQDKLEQESQKDAFTTENSNIEVEQETSPPEEVKKSTTPREKPSPEELRAFAERENFLNLANKGKKEFHVSYKRMKQWLDEAGIRKPGEAEKDAFTRALENVGLIGPDKTIKQAVDEAFSNGPADLLFLNPTPPPTATPDELDIFKISWISDIANSGFAASEKIGVIQSIIDLPGVEA